MLSAPTRTAPASRIRATSVASRRCRRIDRVDLRARERGQARDVEQILYRVRHAGERRQRRAGGARARSTRRASARARSAVTCGEAVDRGIERVDARERRLGDRLQPWSHRAGRRGDGLRRSTAPRSSRSSDAARTRPSGWQRRGRAARVATSAIARELGRCDRARARARADSATAVRGARRVDVRGRSASDRLEASAGLRAGRSRGCASWRR